MLQKQQTFTAANGSEKQETPLVKQKWMVALLATCTYCMVSVTQTDQLGEKVLQNAAIYFLFSSFVTLVTWRLFKEEKFSITGSPTTFAHFLVGIAMYTAFAVLYVIDDITLLEQYYPITLGLYVADIFFILWSWDEVSVQYRHFYCVHHTLAFLVKGTWAFVDGEWTGALILGMMLWRTADIYAYTFQVWRSLPQTQRAYSKRSIEKIRLACFALERIHKLSSYLAYFVVANFDPAGYDFLIGGTAWFMEILDVYFQLKWVYKYIRRIRGKEEEEHMEKTDCEISRIDDSAMADDSATDSCDGSSTSNEINV